MLLRAMAKTCVTMTINVVYWLDSDVIGTRFRFPNEAEIGPCGPRFSVGA